MKAVILFLAALYSLPTFACGVPSWAVDFSKNELILGFLRHGQVLATIDNIQRISVESFTHRPFHTFSNRPIGPSCEDSLELSGVVHAKFSRTLFMNEEKRSAIHSLAAEGRISWEEADRRLARREFCEGVARVKVVQAPRAAGDIASSSTTLDWTSPLRCVE